LTPSPKLGFGFLTSSSWNGFDFFKYLADHYAMSDNFHQSVMGGTGANHVMLGSGDAIWFADPSGTPAQPPSNKLVAAGSPNAGVVDEIENPNPQPGTKTVTAADPLVPLLTEAAPTPPAPILLSLGLRPLRTISALCAGPLMLTASPDTIIF
jgi:phosphoesterase family protein